MAAGVEPAHSYEDLASGKRDGRPGLTACLKALRTGRIVLRIRGDAERVTAALARAGRPRPDPLEDRPALARRSPPCR